MGRHHGPMLALAAGLLGAAGPFPQPQPGISLEPAAGPRALQIDTRPYQALSDLAPGAEEIVVTANRAPTQADPHARFELKESWQNLQAVTLWDSSPGRLPCCRSPYETDIGGQPGK